MNDKTDIKVRDLIALILRILEETGLARLLFEKLKELLSDDEDDADK